MTVEQGIGEPRDQFPIGMRVLAVDDDPTCLLLLETLLRRCQYNVLSAYSDPKLVMKGITHGACDYLLKPVRMEELKNIWQHVIRRRKFDNKDWNNFDNQDKLHHGSDETTADHKLNKKRKDQNEDEDEDRDDNGHENEDPTTQKKPRVVWSVELHRKFVAAVNQLGLDKAVPKKILDLMNVEKLTRENVASHLQKYRLYLKRISAVANQQATMAALGSPDASYLQMGPVNGLGFPNLAGTGQFHNATFRSFPPSGMLGRLNSPAALGMRGLPSAGVIQIGHLPTTGQLTSSQSQFQSIIHPRNGGNVLQGMPMSLEFDQVHSNKVVTYIRDTDVNDTTTPSVSSGFLDAKIMAGSSNGPLLGVSNKSLMLEGNALEAQDGQKFGKQSSLAVASLSLDSGFSSNFLDNGSCNDSWSSSVHSTGIQSNSFALNECFQQATMHPSNIRDCVSTMASQSGNNASHVSSISSMPIHLQDSKADVHCQIASITSNARQMINNAPQRWDDRRQDASCRSNAVCCSINSGVPIHGTGNPMGQSLDPNDVILDRTKNFNSTRQPNIVDPSPMKHDEVENLTMESLMRSNEGYAVGQQNQQGSHVSNNFGSLEDLACVMVKQENKVTATVGEFAYGAYSLRMSM
ncbi:hypothetical protein MANES_03G010500v8 [Manihot esculenta]|uniref:Uncharacterized protein n=1 Tax=Manihot esculenta TaxID=3983 RepID=A0ACB7HWZ5_MANES|nr:hypothetical protein MANES_03G010500v8 [Manihot esculenta]